MKAAFTIFSVCLALAACGGGGSSGGSGAETVPEPVAPALLNGIFIDSAVAGLRYQTATRSGTTGVDGGFSYLEGEEIQFYIGDSLLGSSRGTTILTPADLLNTVNLEDTAVINLARLLQTLDEDETPDNGIVISQATRDVVSSNAPSGLDFSDPDFDNNAQLNAILSSLGIDQLVDPDTAYEHLKKSVYEEFPSSLRALPIPAFNAHGAGGNYFSNIYSPVDEGLENSIYDTLAHDYSSSSAQELALPVGVTPFYDYSKYTSAQNNYGSMAQTYLWIDDALTSRPQLRMRLYGLDLPALVADQRGIGYTYDTARYKITVLLNPKDWTGTILLNDKIVWDEVSILGAESENGDHVTLWLPLESLDIDTSILFAAQVSGMRFFFFDLRRSTPQNVRVIYNFPGITTNLEPPTPLQSSQLDFEFTALNRRTTYSTDEFGNGCQMTSQLSYIGQITWTQDEQGQAQELWKLNTARFDGELRAVEKPDRVGSDNVVYPCESITDYQSGSSQFRLPFDQSELTLNDIQRLFTPSFNFGQYDNAQLLIPLDAVLDPEQHIDSVTLDRSEEKVVLKGHSSCSTIQNCNAQEDDIFDWTLTLSSVPVSVSEANK